MDFQEELMSLIENAIIAGTSPDEVERIGRNVLLGERHDPSTPVPPSLVAAQKALGSAQNELDLEWARFLATIRPLGRDRFWELLPRLRDEIMRPFLDLERSIGVQEACKEFFRKAVRRQDGHGYDEALRFAVAYEELVDAITEEIAVGNEAFSDDAIDALADALPLLGQKACESSPLRPTDLRRNMPRGQNGLGKLIFEGDNHIVIHLNNAAKKYFPAFMQTNA